MPSICHYKIRYEIQLKFHSIFQFGRWSLLGTGILYGIYHQSRLSKKEAAIRVIEAEQKVIRDAQLAIEKKRNTEGIIGNVLSLIYLTAHKIIQINFLIIFLAELKALEELSKPLKKASA